MRGRGVGQAGFDNLDEEVPSVDVSVDENLCQGHARCNLICPEVFDLDEAGFSVVIAAHVPPEHEAKVKEAILNCPERAITTTG
jgi:ferredoxin